MTDIKSMNHQELGAFLKELGEASYREKQVFSWLHKGIRSFDEMTNLPKSLREKLSGLCELTPPKVLRKQESGLDGTVKFLWELADGNSVESVVMRYHHGNTVCISSEVGCPMGCAFCASTIGGLVRRLKPSEMLDQVLFSQIESGLEISNIVLMGIGEPLDNLDTVLRFLELVNDPEGLNIGMRHISLSTCGVVPKIEELMEKDLQLTLSVSLHAPNNELRSSLMPINRRWPLEKLIPACRKYYEKTARRISFEYAMIKGRNDSKEACEELIALLKGLPSHVNLIPLNHVEESPLQPSSREAVRAFQERLEAAGITATVRRTLGSDIDASCGQLRRKQMKEQGR